MDSAIFVQNIKDRCKSNGVLPTIACKESGVGASFINNIETRGQTPSVAKAQMMATYLGCTVSDLLGEKKEDLVISIYDVPPQDTIDEVFEIATQMVPITIKQLERSSHNIPSLFEKNGPYSLTVNAQLQRVTSAPLGEKKEPTLVSESEPLDHMTAQLMEFVRRLTPDQKAFLLAQMKTMLENQ